jgi:NAD(P)-dependent dehydrogenase (short-subunit alcohol dehydrogenase family)
MADDKRASLEGRVALVTGGARGIGFAVAEHLHALGAAVVIADSGVSIAGEQPDPEVAQDAVRRLGTRAAAYTGDLAEAAHAQAAVALAVERFGAIDLVVNNAAILRDGFVFKAKPEDFEAVLRTNLCAAFYVLAAATARMREQLKGGREPGAIVNISSSAGLYGNYGQSAYGASKAGLVGLTRTVALDMARSGVPCNAVVPFAHTRVTEIIQPANEAQALYKERALKVAPKHVAQLVGFLCLPRARAISGQLFGVRGREVFLFAQARPLEKIVAPAQDWTAEELGRAIEAQLADRFAPLQTDLDVFNTEPVI